MAPNATLTLVLALTATAPAASVLYGSLETRAEYDSAFQAGGALEQWVDLGYRDREGRRAGLLAALRANGDGAGADLHRLFLGAPVAEGLDLQAGRFERVDAVGLYTLDGISLKADRTPGRWELFAGVPRRTEIYALPERGDSSLDRPAGESVVGLGFDAPLAPSGDLERGSWGLGARHYGGDTDATRLDGRLSAAWRPAAFGRLDLAAALSVNLDAGRTESFDAQARLRPDDARQWFLRGRTYEPPEDPVSFRDRYYRYYARGRQTLAEAGYRERVRAGLEWGADLRVVARDSGPEGAGGSLLGEVALNGGSRLEARIDWLQAGDEYARGLFAELRRPLDARTLVSVGGALRGERTLAGGERRVAAAELRVEWMWRRDLFLKAHLEAAQRDGDGGASGELRCGVRLIYRLPAQGAEDYR